MGVAPHKDEHARACAPPPERPLVSEVQQSDLHGPQSGHEGTVIQVQHLILTRGLAQPPWLGNGEKNISLWFVNITCSTPGRDTPINKR